MGKEEISKLLEESRKALEAKCEEMRGQISSELDSIRKKALSG